ncbi:hypothetical protein [Aerococcus sp. UMB7834]|uniref:hypothetical protein n=1 Tax=Aerococcus sp. UMB7834 TaxID=3046342 RepID=UPI00254EEED1|nr:hypothetical protein [Aerococcus sp. UMB7834]MDK6805115.1 hypothetical protein [Aerococcus sp. UMB7834]
MKNFITALALILWGVFIAKSPNDRFTVLYAIITVGICLVYAYLRGKKDTKL